MRIAFWMGVCLAVLSSVTATKGWAEVLAEYKFEGGPEDLIWIWIPR